MTRTAGCKWSAWCHACRHQVSHTYELDFVMPLNSRESILAVDESYAEPKERIKHYGAL